VGRRSENTVGGVVPLRVDHQRRVRIVAATIVCTYDTRSVPESVLSNARRTHPEVAGADLITNPSYANPETSC